MWMHLLTRINMPADIQNNKPHAPCDKRTATNVNTATAPRHNKKTKVSESECVSNKSSFLFHIPRVVLCDIAQYLLPIDACQLGQCTKLFHEHNPRHLQLLKKNSTAKELLNASLTSSLDYILKLNNATFNTKQF
mmetsp:Transcript_8039/g.22487  ORF Transcript_8039/g.22487 Transcript_8039/m.22487 type:complete len:135 (-) Transcript_8039:59-463(-)